MLYAKYGIYKRTLRQLLSMTHAWAPSSRPCMGYNAIVRAQGCSQCRSSNITWTNVPIWVQYLPSFWTISRWLSDKASHWSFQHYVYHSLDSSVYHLIGSKIHRILRYMRPVHPRLRKAYPGQ